MKKLIGIALLTSIMILGACDKKSGDSKDKEGKAVEVNCKTLSEKNSKCADELVAVFMADMGDKVPAEMKEKMKAKLKQSVAGEMFQKQCEKHWDSDNEKDKKTKEQFTKCFKMKDCKEYAACLKKTM